MTKAIWEDDRSVRRIRIVGDLDHVGYETVGSAVHRAVVESRTPGVLLDLSAVRFFAGMGIALLIEARRRVVATGRTFVLAGLAPQARRVLETVGFLDAYPDCVAAPVA